MSSIVTTSRTPATARACRPNNDKTIPVASMVSGGRGDPERMHDRDISGLACRWNLSPELEADRRSLQVEHAELERQHLEMSASDCDAAAQIAHAEKSGCTSADCTR